MKAAIVGLIMMGAAVGLIAAIKLSPWVLQSLLGLFWLWQLRRTLKGSSPLISAVFFSLGISLTALPLWFFVKGMDMSNGLSFFTFCFFGGPLLHAAAEKFVRRTSPSPS